MNKVYYLGPFLASAVGPLIYFCLYGTVHPQVGVSDRPMDARRGSKHLLAGISPITGDDGAGGPKQIAPTPPES